MSQSGPASALSRPSLRPRYRHLRHRGLPFLADCPRCRPRKRWGGGPVEPPPASFQPARTVPACNDKTHWPAPNAQALAAIALRLRGQRQINDESDLNQEERIGIIEMIAKAIK